MNQFYYNKWEGTIFDNKVTDYTIMHYGEPEEKQVWVTDNFEELFERISTKKDPFARIYTTIFGKKIISIEKDNYGGHAYIKPNTKFKYTLRYYSKIVNPDEIRAKELMDLPVEEYALWCKDHGLCCNLEK